MPSEVPPLPRWITAEPGGIADAHLQCGAALGVFDALIRGHPPWAGLLRQRLALEAAQVSARRMRIIADAAALRDIRHFTRGSDDPGPAGRIALMWRRFVACPLPLTPTDLRRLIEPLGLDPGAEAAEQLCGLVLHGGAPLSAVAAALASGEEDGSTGGRRVLSWLLADAALAHTLGWKHSVPLCAGLVPGGRGAPDLAFDPATAARAASGPEPSGSLAAGLAVALIKAHRLARDIDRRAARLAVAQPGLRSKGRDSALSALLNADSVTPADLTGLGSERAARRLLDRLQALGVVRELSGRTTFRIYGL